MDSTPVFDWLNLFFGSLAESTTTTTTTTTTKTQTEEGYLWADFFGPKCSEGGAWAAQVCSAEFWSPDRWVYLSFPPWLKITIERWCA